MSDETIRLELDVNDESLKQAQATVVTTTKDVYEFADSYELLEKEIAKSIPIVSAAEKAFKDVDYEMVMMGTHATSTAASIGKATTAAAGFGKGGADMSRAALEAARGLEDLQYGISGIVNNVPGMVLAAGGTLGMAAALNILMVAINQTVKHWPEMVAMFTQTTDFSESVGGLNELNDQLKTAKDRLDELKQQDSGSGKDLEEYINLLRTTAEIEERITKEKKTQLEVKKLLELRPPSEIAEEKERAKLLEEAFAGKQQQLIDAAMLSGGDSGKLQALSQASQRRAALIGPGGQITDEAGFQREFAPRVGESFKDTLNRVNVEHRAAVEKETKRITENAEKLVRDALIGGKAGAAQTLGAMAARAPGLFPPGAADRFGAVGPGFVAAKKADAENAKLDEAERKAKAARRAAADREVEEANKQDARRRETAAAKAARDDARTHKLSDLTPAQIRGVEEARKTAHLRDQIMANAKNQGGNIGFQQAHQIAKRSLALQNKSVGAAEATQQAMMEMQNTQNWLGNRMTKLEQNARRMQARSKTMQRKVN